jgi:hypothetical protein
MRKRLKIFFFLTKIIPVIFPQEVTTLYNSDKMRITQKKRRGITAFNIPPSAFSVLHYWKTFQVYHQHPNTFFFFSLRYYNLFVEKRLNYALPNVLKLSLRRALWRNDRLFNWLHCAAPACLLPSKCFKFRQPAQHFLLLNKRKCYVGYL